MYIVVKNYVVASSVQIDDAKRAKEIAVESAEAYGEMYVVLEVIAKAKPQKRPVLLEEVKKDV